MGRKAPGHYAFLLVNNGYKIDTAVFYLSNRGHTGVTRPKWKHSFLGCTAEGAQGKNYMNSYEAYMGSIWAWIGLQLGHMNLYGPNYNGFIWAHVSP